jgi:hypothetical protein
MENAPQNIAGVVAALQALTIKALQNRVDSRQEKRLDRTQEVVGSSPTGSIKDLLMRVSCFLHGLQRAPG